MIRFAPYLLLLAAALAGLFWITQRVGGPRALPRSADLVARAAAAYGPDRGPGQLTLNPTQLVFTAGSGRVSVIERIDITGVTTTNSLPDRESASPVLAISTASEVHYFLVDQPEAWVQRLT